jgi:pimeloyl-ACP methyl ester carboxylesterase
VTPTPVPTPTPVVLVHGGGFDGRCWDLVVPRLAGPAIAVDLPGRGRRPADLRSVTIADCGRAIADDVDAAGFDEVVLVGHSLAGCSLPAAIGLLGDRVRHAVFVACTVPADGTSCFDTLDPEIQAMTKAASQAAVASGAVPDRGLDPAIAKVIFGNDLDDDQFAWCVERLVPEAPGLTLEPVDLAPLRTALPRTWVRTLQDAVIDPGKQLRFAANVGDCPVVDLDAAHMCMISQPAATAAILDGLAAQPTAAV